MKNFRNGDEVGPDYKCSKCGRTNCRLWRESYIFLNQVELLCFVCAVQQEEKNIEKYAKTHEPWSPTIGDLVPARPTPEGDTFWGQTSGDTVWWYGLRQFNSDILEAGQLRTELIHCMKCLEYEHQRRKDVE